MSPRPNGWQIWHVPAILKDNVIADDIFFKELHDSKFGQREEIHKIKSAKLTRNEGLEPRPLSETRKLDMYNG